MRSRTSRGLGRLVSGDRLAPAAAPAARAESASSAPRVVDAVRARRRAARVARTSRPSRVRIQDGGVGQRRGEHAPLLHHRLVPAPAAAASRRRSRYRTPTTGTKTTSRLNASSRRPMRDGRQPRTAATAHARSSTVAVPGAVDAFDAGEGRIDDRRTCGGSASRGCRSCGRSPTRDPGYASSISCSRVLTAPGRRTSDWSSRNSVTVSGTACSRQVTSSRSGIEHEAAGGHRPIVRLARRLDVSGAPQQHLDARHQLAHRERLAQVVVGADLEAEHAVELLLARRHEDDRQRLGPRAQPAAQFEAVHPRQADVEDHEVGERARTAPPTRSGHRRTAAGS